VVVTTNENYADLLVRQYSGSLAASKKDGKVEVGLSFDSPRAALRFVVEGADRIRLQSPKSLKADVADWLKEVNRGKAPSLEEMKFTGPATNDVLGQTLQLLHAVYVAEDGLRISELAKRFSLDDDHVRLIMDRLVALEPMAGSTDGTGAFRRTSSRSATTGTTRPTMIRRTEPTSVTCPRGPRNLHRSCGATCSN